MCENSSSTEIRTADVQATVLGAHGYSRIALGDELHAGTRVVHHLVHRLVFHLFRSAQLQAFVLPTTIAVTTPRVLALLPSDKWRPESGLTSHDISKFSILRISASTREMLWRGRVVMLIARISFCRHRLTNAYIRCCHHLYGSGRHIVLC